MQTPTMEACPTLWHMPGLRHFACHFREQLALQFSASVTDCQEQRVCEEIVQSSQSPGPEAFLHWFGHGVGVENEHGGRPSIKRGGSRMGSLGGISSSTPPNGLNSSCIAVPSFLVGTGSSSRAARRMSRASCSMEWPFSAARMRSRLFNPSSRLRIVILATMQPPVLLSREYRMIAVQSVWLSGLLVLVESKSVVRILDLWQSPVYLHPAHGSWYRMQEVAHFRSFFSLRGSHVLAASSTRTVFRSVMRTGHTVRSQNHGHLHPRGQVGLRVGSQGRHHHLHVPSQGGGSRPATQGREYRRCPR